MSWTLKRPGSSTFDTYKKLAPGEPWNSKNYITVDESAPESWSAGSNGFVRMIEKNHKQIHAMGMHEFMICDDGTIANMGYAQVAYPNGYYYYDQTKKVLNSGETQIDLPVPTSLRYLMHTYPNIRWSIQILATKNSSGDRVNPLLDNKANQDNCIRQTRKIVELYKAAGFPIADIEVDCEKTTTRDGDAQKFRDFLVRIKNEACIPTGTGLRVNLFAMTGDFVPAYYGWHDYRTLASGVDKNGQQAIDEFQLMTYDFSWGGSAPGPSTPLWWLEQVLEHVNNVLPPEKTLIGNAGYGRRWPLSERRMGVTFDYKQLMQAQNGMYVHNDGASTPTPTASNPDKTTFFFRNQDFIPFAGYNDPNSDYQMTYLFVYDRFKAEHGIGNSDIIRPAGSNYVTTYSNKQRPTFDGIQAIVKTPTTRTGNTSGNTSIYPDFVYNNQDFYLYRASRARWFWDKGKLDENGDLIPGTGACIVEKGDTGIDGSLEYTFDLPQAGSYKVIALVSFPFFGQDHFDINVNGSIHKIGESIPDWYPFITNPSVHFWDCGTYSLQASNSIKVGLTNGAAIGGFIICKNYDENITGGEITFPANLQKMKKRGPKDSEGNSQLVDAAFPENMTLTGEVLRRPPRPAIIWEDMFGPHIQGDFTESTDLTSAGEYYRKANPSLFSSGSGPNPHTVGDRTYCISGVSAAGFSQGEWFVKDTSDVDAAHTWSKCTQYSQLVLNKLIANSAHIELDCRVGSTDSNARYGIRLMNKKGDPSSGWIFRLNFRTKQVEFYDLNSPSNSRYTDMSSNLSQGLGNRYTLKLERINGQIHCIVGDTTYFIVPDPIVGAAAYGAYGVDCTIKVYRLNVSSLDRFESMEKMSIKVDGVEVAKYGEVERNVPYDQFGYLVHTSLPGNLTEAVRAIPSESESSDGTSSQVEGRSGTIFETEVKPEDWSLDYKNLPLTQVPSWIGKKNVTISMKDPGIWFRTFYVGDSEGYSVAYNSDKIGFIRTSQMILDYKCKGIALWTLGQEDPSVFEYLPKS